MVGPVHFPLLPRVPLAAYEESPMSFLCSLEEAEVAGTIRYWVTDTYSTRTDL